MIENIFVFSCYNRHGGKIMIYTYADTCPKCDGEAITYENNKTQRIECQEENCFWTEIA